MSKEQVTVTVNGKRYERTVEPRRLLSDFIREDIGLTGTHVGCEHGICGTCTVLMNGSTARSCLTFAVQAHAGRDHHRRVSRHPDQHAPAAGGVLGASRAPVRVLYPPRCCSPPRSCWTPTPRLPGRRLRRPSPATCAAAPATRPSWRRWRPPPPGSEEKDNERSHPPQRRRVRERLSLDRPEHEARRGSAAADRPRKVHRRRGSPEHGPRRGAAKARTRTRASGASTRVVPKRYRVSCW